MLDHFPSLLVVEDDDYVRNLIRSLLAEAGFDVTGAPTGWAALEVLEVREFDLLVVDIGLPGGFTGLDLVQCARVRHPLVKCLFISGTREPTTDDPERDDFVGKPFHSAELVGCVWELLQRKVADSEIGWPLRQQKRQAVAERIARLKRPRGILGGAATAVEPPPNACAQSDPVSVCAAK